MLYPQCEVRLCCRAHAGGSATPLKEQQKVHFHEEIRHSRGPRFAQPLLGRMQHPSADSERSGPVAVRS
ncbi:hypothetical protein FQA47_024054 [Oryzias melastigma]|uniref:Uncharacterized protein n=1 Tax=Oryzias melastigma TaxID=30732 RepID=A0A834BN51_ORYME|nr:hypothetical protein FQA47_024054 [Oryzias melastigma]